MEKDNGSIKVKPSRIRFIPIIIYTFFVSAAWFVVTINNDGLALIPSSILYAGGALIGLAGWEPAKTKIKEITNIQK